jgi:hypothetical protein
MNVLVVALAGDDELGLGVLARRAKHEFVNERVEELAKAVGLVRAVDDVAVVGERRLRAELTPEELGRVCDMSVIYNSHHSCHGASRATTHMSAAC